MLISDGTTFDRNSVANLKNDEIWGCGGEKETLSFQEWDQEGRPDGIGLFQGTKEGRVYTSICLTEEFEWIKPKKESIKTEKE